LTTVEISVEMALIRAIIDDRLRRVWTILLGMLALAVTVVMVTAMIHDRIQ
jgi:hypothetical protein